MSTARKLEHKEEKKTYKQVRSEMEKTILGAFAQFCEWTECIVKNDLEVHQDLIDILRSLVEYHDHINTKVEPNLVGLDYPNYREILMGDTSSVRLQLALEDAQNFAHQLHQDISWSIIEISTESINQSLQEMNTEEKEEARKSMIRVVEAEVVG